ncbi:uncharacterized protein TNCV_480671 [Trichonephila clavipes]|nr:uncharacterized protein TNCV_480671 [Trichonephila clavipes]
MAGQGDQEHIAIEMDEFDNRPFAERAADPLVLRQSARLHRITPQPNVRGLYGRQVLRQVVVRDPSRSEQSRRRSRIETNEPINETGQPTDEQRQWYRQREAAEIENARSPMSTERKFCIFGGIAVLLILVVLIIIIVYVVLNYEPPENPPTLSPRDLFAILRTRPH